MSKRSLASISALVAVIAMSVAQAPIFGQAPAGQAKQAAVSKTLWGDPDLQGVYTFSTDTPLQRPSELADKATLTEAELSELEERANTTWNTTEREFPVGNPGSYNNIWQTGEQGRLTGRTSLITDPANGRLPPLTPQGQQRRNALVAEAAARRVGTPPFVQTLYNSWLDHPTFTRCVARPMPRIGQAYNHGIQILQTPGQVVLHYESLHEVRVIPVDGRPHIDPKIRQWNGDPRGRWEGNTLVVDWTNFTDKQEFEGASQGNMHFTERFTRIDAKTLNYEVTVNDPTTWTRPWTFAMPLRADDPNYENPEDLYEYACHEGNYRMMENSVGGSRVLKAQTGQK